MPKNLIACYSRTGNNRYLAERASAALGAELVFIRPRITPFAFLLLASATKISAGIRKMEIEPEKYDSVILCGPIWMGQFVAPLRDFLKIFGGRIRKLHFICSCGSRDSTCEEKFGYKHVFGKIREMMEERSGIFKAFPVELSLPEEKRNDDQAMMEARFTDSSFRGALEERLNEFVGIIASGE